MKLTGISNNEAALIEIVEDVPMIISGCVSRARLISGSPMEIWTFDFGYPVFCDEFLVLVSITFPLDHQSKQSIHRTSSIKN